MNLRTSLFQIITDALVLIIQIIYEAILSLLDLIIRKEPESVKGEVVLVTGGGHGIGKELALVYASEGATVVIWDINQETAIQTVKEIEVLGYPKAYFFVCDVSNRDDVSNVAKRVETEVGDVTILINNAGIMPTHPFLHHTNDEIEKIMNVNVMAHFWVLQAFLPSMQKHNYGHIVAISSCVGLYGMPNLVPYSCSKYAVRGLMESLYHEFREDKTNRIKFTTVYPYMVDTGLCKKPKIRFPNVMKMVQPRDVAKQVMDAQRKGLREIAVPRYFIILRILGIFLPTRVQIRIVDFCAVGLESDLS